MPYIVVMSGAALALLYVFVLRPVLKDAPTLSKAFAAEASFVTQLRVKVVGWKTKIAARLLAISGLLVGLYDQVLPLIAGQDWTPITAKIPSWVLPVSMFSLAWLFSYLRKITENPPQVVTQKTDDGNVHVVALLEAPSVVEKK